MEDMTIVSCRPAEGVWAAATYAAQKSGAPRLGTVWLLIVNGSFGDLVAVITNDIKNRYNYNQTEDPSHAGLQALQLGNTTITIRLLSIVIDHHLAMN